MELRTSDVRVLERQAAVASGPAVRDEYAYDAFGRLTIARNDTATQSGRSR